MTAEVRGMYLSYQIIFKTNVRHLLDIGECTWNKESTDNQTL